MSQRAFALGAIPAALWFTLRAAPSVAFRDAGELTAASFLLDVAHPTGFPADVLLVRLAMLVPLGDLALRANLAVASLMALACGCASVLAFRLVPTLAPTARLAVDRCVTRGRPDSREHRRLPRAQPQPRNLPPITLPAHPLTRPRQQPPQPLFSRRRRFVPSQ